MVEMGMEEVGRGGGGKILGVVGEKKDKEEIQNKNKTHKNGLRERRKKS